MSSFTLKESIYSITFTILNEPSAFLAYSKMKIISWENGSPDGNTMEAFAYHGSVKMSLRERLMHLPGNRRTMGVQ